MNTFANAVTNMMTTTENGMPSPVSSNSACVDLFYKIGSSRGQDIIPAFTAAFVENKDLALRIVLHARDIRQGSGERQIFKDILRHLETVDGESACRLMDKVGELGRWDDLFIDHASVASQNYAFCLIEEALKSGNSLVFKWIPREKSAKGDIANDFRIFLGMSPKEYRKFLVAGTNVTENKMCANEWDDINFSQVPSVCHARNKKAFGRHTTKYQEYVAALIKGEAVIQAGAIFPHDVLKGKITTEFSMFNHSNPEYSETELAVIEQQWKALPNYIGDSNILPLVDVSGSMCCSVSGSTTALDIAVSLGLYCADKNTGIFKDMFLTFSGEPELLLLKGNIIQKIDQMVTSKWAMNTDLNKVFAKILKTAIEGKVPQDEMPKVLLILSDQQYDQSTDFSETALQMITRKYTEAGYNTPTIIYWNLLNRDNVPVKFDTNGTALVSGYSPSVLKAILKNDMEEFTPENIMLQTVCVPRYDY